jgi:VIT1/CCC1 family predicted Fe2+/Mn2+ transporter
MEERILKNVLEFQRDEITGHVLYNRLADISRDERNASVLRAMAEAEEEHYRFWYNLSKQEVAPDRFKVAVWTFLARILGLTFTLKLMEQGERATSNAYARFEDLVPGAARMGAEEDQHEADLMNMIEEEHLAYVGSIVLGLNDALVELTGTLAGLTFALQDGKLVAVSGIITGIAASFSMAASDYLASRAEGNRQARKSAIYTGLAYLITVFLLVLPYLLLPTEGSWIFISLGITLLIAVLIIFTFNFYLSVAKDLPFTSRFLEMLGISLGVAAFSFLVGILVRTVFGIEV